MRRRWPSIEGVAAACLLLILTGCGEPSLVEDEAGLLTAAERRRIAEFHRLLKADHGIDYRVLTLHEAQDVERIAVDRFEAMAIGGSDKGGRGLLLLIDSKGKRVRLEVGRALEGVFTDAFVSYVEHRQMVPFFAAGRTADGVLATTELIVQHAKEARAAGDRWSGSGPALSGGAGATASTPSAAMTEPALQAPSGRASISSPEETLVAYLEGLRQAHMDPSLFTPASRELMRNWVQTPAQTRMLLRIYRRCHAQPPRFDPARRFAVIRYPIEERECAPWFLTAEAEGWRLDLAAMQREIRFGRSNEWRLAREAGSTYHFAFEDWSFDANGFPVRVD